MEKVFWLMWLADIVGNIGLVGFTSLLAMGAAFVFMIIATGMDEKAVYVRGWRAARWLLIPIGLACVTPNPATVRVMAIATAGEAAANTALGAKGMEALDAVLDKVIAQSKK